MMLQIFRKLFNLLAFHMVKFHLETLQHVIRDIQIKNCNSQPVHLKLYVAKAKSLQEKTEREKPKK